MKVTTFFILLAMYVSCKTHSVLYGPSGTYMAKGKDFEYTLNLSADGTFELEMVYQDPVPACFGTWKYLANDTLLLSCSNNTDINTTLSNGFMNDRTHKIKIINNDKFKFKNVTLERQK